MPYGAKDVDAPRRIMHAQEKKLAPFRKPRGEYPSIWDIDMHTSKILYEPEEVGLLVDPERLAQMTELYQTRRDEMETKIVCMAQQLGHEDFNVRAWQQVGKLLFDTLDMTPIRTTGKKIPWERVMAQMEELQEDVNASTDKETLAILADNPGANPIVRLIADFRKVEYVCTQWLVPPEEAAKYDYTTRKGGLLSKLWLMDAARELQSAEGNGPGLVRRAPTCRIGSSEPRVI